MFTSLISAFVYSMPVLMVFIFGSGLIYRNMTSAGLVVSSMIIGLAIFYYIWFLLATQRVERFLTNLEAPTATSQSLEKHPVWQDYWRNMVTDARSGQPRSRLSAEAFINPRRLLAKEMNQQFFQSFPNILVGIGIFFTFMGLAVALQAAGQSLTTSNNEVMRKALENLFSAASFKFITSITGLGCSVIFSIVEKYHLHHVAVRCQELARLLDQRFPVMRFDEAMLEATAASGAHEAAVAMQSAAVAMESAAGKMETQMAALSAIQGSLTPEAIGKQVGQAMHSIFAQELVPVFKDIQVELGALREIKQDQGQEILRNLIQEMRREVLEPMAEQIEANAVVTREASQAVQDLNRDLVAITQKLQETTQTIEVFQTKTLQRLQDFAESLREILNQFGHETQGVLKTVAAEIHRAVEESIEGMEKQRAAFEESARDAASTFVGIRDELHVSLHHQIQAQKSMLVELKGQMGELMAQATGAIDHTTESVRQVVADSATAMETQRDHFEASLDAMTATFKQIRGELQGALADQTQVQRDMLGEVKSEMGDVLNQANHAFADTRTHIQAAVEAGVNALHEQRTAFVRSTQETADSFDRLRQNVSESLREQTLAQREMLGEVQNQMDAVIARSGEAMVETTATIQSMVSASTRSLEMQQSAFEASAAETSRTFIQIRHDLEASLERQTDTQRVMLGEVKRELGDVLHQANEAFRNTTGVIEGAVARSVEAMHEQRDAFASSASEAAKTFTGIRADLESALRTQAELEAQRLDALQGRTRELLERVEGTFDAQMRTLAGVGQEASSLMSSAKENLIASLTDVRTMLVETRVTVQEELESFRVKYQEALNTFFLEQNQLLEGTLGQQREGLASVVTDLQHTFASESERRAAMSREVDQAVTQLLETLTGLERFSAAVGLMTGERVLELQTLASECGRQARQVEDAYRGLVSHVQQAMSASNDQMEAYLAKAESREKQFFQGYDEAVSKLTDGLLQTAEFLAEAEHHRREALSR